MNLESGVLQVHIEDIIPNRFQPRLNFDEQGLKELSDSIKEHGIIQPLVLRKLGNKYEIIAGERRYKAAQLAGLTTVPAVVANIDDNKSAEVALVENVQRRDLTAIEEARSYKNLLDKGYLTQEQLAKRMGLSQPSIANKLRLLNLDEEVQQALLEEKISERHARTLLSLDDKSAQREWLHRIINERLTVRQLDLELKKMKELNINYGMNNGDGYQDVPLVENKPSIEEIKANAFDISSPRERMNQAEKLNEFETLDLNQPIVDEPSYKTATTIPDFNISTPNSNIDMEAGIPSEIDNKYFNFNNVPSFDIPTYSSTINESNVEVFDSPNQTNDFVETKQEEKVIVEEPKHENYYDDFNFNPNSKFFTPVSNPSDYEIKKEVSETIDPMSFVDNLTINDSVSPDKPTLAETIKGGKNLKDAINSIRECIQSLGDKGFYINVEEIDFDSNYQITIQINKDI